MFSFYTFIHLCTPFLLYSCTVAKNAKIPPRSVSSCSIGKWPCHAAWTRDQLLQRKPIYIYSWYMNPSNFEPQSISMADDMVFQHVPTYKNRSSWLLLRTCKNDLDVQLSSPLYLAIFGAKQPADLSTIANTGLTQCFATKPFPMIAGCRGAHEATLGGDFSPALVPWWTSPLAWCYGEHPKTSKTRNRTKSSNFHRSHQPKFEWNWGYFCKVFFWPRLDPTKAIRSCLMERCVTPMHPLLQVRLVLVKQSSLEKANKTPLTSPCFSGYLTYILVKHQQII